MNKLNKKSPTLSESFARINSKKLRWQGILELNMSEDVSNIDDILAATKDSFWMTRWVAVTKLEQLKNNKAINVLLNLLYDDDETVRKSTARAIHAKANMTYLHYYVDVVMRTLQYLSLLKSMYKEIYLLIINKLNLLFCMKNH